MVKQVAVWAPRWRWPSTTDRHGSAGAQSRRIFARESCGWCTPCRDGLPWSVKILRARSAAKASGDIETLEQLCRFLGPGKTFCAHAPGAVEPLQSAIKYFREEFEAGIKQQFSNTHAINGIQPNLLKTRW